jgi:hypothetical protein
MSRNEDPFENVSEQTVRRAEAMCQEMGLGLTLDRRGQAREYRGFLTDLDDPDQQNIPVAVADVAERSWLTLLADRPLEPCEKALLVFRMPPTEDRKYLGRHGATRPGQRGGDDRDRYVLTFDIVRDARRG